MRYENPFGFDATHGNGADGALPCRFVDNIDDEYELQAEPIGSGSFGEVWIGRRRQGPGLPPAEGERQVAVKRIKPNVRHMVRKAGNRMRAVQRMAAGLGKVRAAAAAGGGGGGESPHPTTTAAAGAAAPAAAAAPVEEAPAPEPAAAAAGAAAAPRTAVAHSKQAAMAEADVLNRVRGSPHVVELLDLCEDETYVYIIMQFCEGGDLMKYVQRCTHFSEKVASFLFRQMLLGVAHCHSRGVVHRDLKPDNFLFLSTEGRAHLIVADLGLAAAISKPNEVLRDGVGSAFFIAPEVLSRKYTSSCDIWSLGINLYLLLSGTVPFGSRAKKAKEVYESIRKDKLSFQGPAWANISPSARELVAGLLEKEPYRRYTLQQALSHPWVVSDGVATDAPIDPGVIDAMYHFNARNKLRREALRLVASTLSAADLRQLREQFHTIDKDTNLSISYAELADALHGLGFQQTREEVDRLMHIMDADQDGQIDLDEFIAATAEMQMIDHQNNIWWAFCQYDANNDGHVTVEELRAVLEGEQEAEVQRYIAEYDKDNDGRINYEEFLRMLAPPGMAFRTIQY